MGEYRASTYGDQIADVYDVLFKTYDPAAIETLAELAGQGPVLELGIGTGRLALPLAERGVVVHGIDASPAMVEKLRSKPGGATIPITLGDFSSVTLDGKYSLVFVAFNTLFGLQTQEDQVRCFRHVAALLGPGGVFLIEAFVPDMGRFDRGQRLAVSQVDPDRVWVEAARHDAATQRVNSQLVAVAEKGVQLFPIRIRYAWPSELDLMAQLAGLKRRDRWSNWKREPFCSESPAHVSVYELGH